MDILKCKTCKKSIKNRNTVYCSFKCYTSRYLASCKICQKKFITYPSVKQLTCSKICRYKWLSKNYRGKEYSKNCEEAPKAWAKFNHAVERNGLKRKPCEICGNNKSHGHHKDYAQPFEVNWLCAKHHQLVHIGKLKI